MEGTVVGSGEAVPAVSQTVNGEEADSERVYLDFNATTPLDPEVIHAVNVAMKEAWGNPSSSYTAGRKAKEIVSESRENVAALVGGRPGDIIFTSGGTEANNLVFHTAVRHFWEEKKEAGQKRPGEGHDGIRKALPHIVTSNVEHDSVKLAAENLGKEGRAEVSFVAVSSTTGRTEVEDVLSAVRPTTCLISIMLANNETGVLMPIREISRRVKALNKARSDSVPRILLHTDAAQAIGKVRVDVDELGVDYLTIVGHKFYGPRIGALYVRGPGTTTPVYPMFFGGGQERNFRPGTENTPMIAGLGKAAELVKKNLDLYQRHMKEVRDHLEDKLTAVFGKDRVRFNSCFPGSDGLPNTCNVSILGPGLKGREVLAHCQKLLASVGAACHSDVGDRPSHILLNCGIPNDVARNALRLSVGRTTTREEIDMVVEDLGKAVAQLEKDTS
ncbi:selenocysteine lyase [Latimeria chalumnae]|uniref:selenocysteine lyase n=1 Tax=Latimeria chalumnae TaxID=7897 RepID=UPI00313CEF73